MKTELLTMKEAKKIVRRRYPFAASVQADPFYGWAILGVERPEHGPRAKAA